MGKEMSPLLAKIYTDFTAEQEGNRVRRSEEAGKRERVKELFNQGVNILEEFGDRREGTRGIAGTENISGIRVSTPSVALEHEGKEVDFIIQGFKPKHLSPKSPLPNSYEYISVHRVKKGDYNFEVDDVWLLLMHAGRIEIPFIKEVNSNPEELEAASELFNAIQQSLSETHIPRSQQVKPEPEKRGLANIFRVLKPAGKL